MLTMIIRGAMLLLVFSFAPAAFAQSPLPEIAGRPHDRAQFDRRFRAADKDGDGALTREEARRSMPSVYQQFDKIDADKDGKVTREELEAAFSRRAREARQRLMALDADRDGVISREEIRRNVSVSSRAIDGIDADKDGRITQGELDGFIQRRYYWDVDRKIAPNVMIRGQF